MTEKKRTAKGQPAGGEFAAHERDEGSVTLPSAEPQWPTPPVAGAHRSRRYPSGGLEATEVYDSGLRIKLRTIYFDITSVISSQKHYANGELHDDAEGKPAVTSFHESGALSMSARFFHGQSQDSAAGDPAVLVMDASGAEQFRQHHQGGKLQDPAPGVPAEKITLDAQTSRWTYATAGVVTKREDRILLPAPGYGDHTLISTSVPE